MGIRGGDVLKIHILTIVRDDIEGLVRTLNSIKFQDCSLVELSVTVIDGYSAISPKSILDNFKELNITLIIREPRGIYNAMNEGLKELSASCSLRSCSVVFLNAGDFFIDKLALEKLARANEISKISVGEAVLLDPAERPRINKPKVNFGVGREFMHPIVYWLPHQGLSATHEVYRSVGFFNEKYKIAGDYEWISRAVLEFGVPGLVLGKLVAQMTDGISNIRSFSGYQERQLLSRSLNLPTIKLPFALVVKMYLKEFLLTRFPRMRPEKENHIKESSVECDHPEYELCPWCFFDQFSQF